MGLLVLLKIQEACQAAEPSSLPVFGGLRGLGRAGTKRRMFDCGMEVGGGGTGCSRPLVPPGFPGTPAPARGLGVRCRPFRPRSRGPYRRRRQRPGGSRHPLQRPRRRPPRPPVRAGGRGGAGGGGARGLAGTRVTRRWRLAVPNGLFDLLEMLVAVEERGSMLPGARRDQEIHRWHSESPGPANGGQFPSSGPN